MTEDAWSSIPWTPFTTQESSSPILAWCKQQVPYKPEANNLQTLEIWIPNESPSSSSQQPPPVSETPTRPGIWIIYIHGGAWRDPLVSATAFTSTVSNLLSKHTKDLSKIAGLASLDYTLSPHPTHPTHPTTSDLDPEIPNSPSRNGKHPDHINDILTGITYLQNKFNFSDDYILAGHSCGATLAFQVAMSSPSRWSPTPADLPAEPIAILGLNGLYDLPSLISNPGPKHIHLAPLYTAFTQSAFGPDEQAWSEISPSSITDWDATWPNGKCAILVQSHEDSLVPYSQTEMMLTNLRRGSKKVEVMEMEAEGDHNEIWQHGEKLADILVDVVDGLSE